MAKAIKIAAELNSQARHLSVSLYYQESDQ
jgi:hypothetical protein